MTVFTCSDEWEAMMTCIYRAWESGLGHRNIRLELESVLQQYQETVKPMHEKYVEPSKRFAHIVVPEGGKNLVALDMIMNRIQRHMEEQA